MVKAYSDTILSYSPHLRRVKQCTGCLENRFTTIDYQEIGPLLQAFIVPFLKQSFGLFFLPMTEIFLRAKLFYN